MTTTTNEEPQETKRQGGYKGLACDCKTCQALTQEEREAKQERILAGRRKGGKIRAAQPSMYDARSAGFWATMERHGSYALTFLRRKIKAQDRSRVVRSLIPERPSRRRKPMR